MINMNAGAAVDGATHPLSTVSFGQPYERDGVTVITAARS